MIDDIYIMWLGTIKGMTIRRQKIMINALGSAKEIWTASENLIYSIPGIPSNVAYNVIKSRNEKFLYNYQEKMRKNKIHFLSQFSPHFPSLLKNINNAPMGIYIIGKLPPDDLIKISIIGSRKCSEYGARSAQNISYDLALNNTVIVSGMARGIDTIAHNSAIKAKGKTIAVLGCGIDICYPPENFKLREQIIQNGCIISEFPLGVKPVSKNFPIRNRIISGLCNGIIIVEASERSGTLITASHALEQGREVMALPGNINSELSRGTNYLIKQGATLVTDYRDVLSEFNLQPVSKFEESQIDNYNNGKNLENMLAIDEQLVYNCVRSGYNFFDQIASNLDLETKTISSCLIMLELKGLIKKLPGQKYICN